MIAGWEREIQERESEMESCGTLEPKVLSHNYHQREQRKQGTREVKGLTQRHTAVRDRVGMKPIS